MDEPAAEVEVGADYLLEIGDELEPELGNTSGTEGVLDIAQVGESGSELLLEHEKKTLV